MRKTSKSKPKACKSEPKLVKNKVKPSKSDTKPGKSDANQHIFDEFGIKPTYGKTLICNRTGEVMLFDHTDWLKINCCKWYLNEKNVILNESGITFETYVGIKKKKRASSNLYDFRRSAYVL